MKSLDMTPGFPEHDGRDVRLVYAVADTEGAQGLSGRITGTNVSDGLLGEFDGHSLVDVLLQVVLPVREPSEMPLVEAHANATRMRSFRTHRAGAMRTLTNKGVPVAHLEGRVSNAEGKRPDDALVGFAGECLFDPSHRITNGRVGKPKSVSMTSPAVVVKAAQPARYSGLFTERATHGPSIKETA